MKIEINENCRVSLLAMATALTTIGNAGGVVTSVPVLDTEIEIPIDTTENLIPPPEFDASMPVDDNLPPPATDTDSAGNLWDVRVHARTKTKNADGTWKILRRPKEQYPTDELWKAYIESVLLGSPTPVTDVPPPAETPVTDVPPPADNDELTLPKLLKLITSAKGAITSSQIAEICTNYDIKSLAELKKPDYAIFLPTIYGEIQELIG